MECHHKVPFGHGTVRATKLADLALVCANCHRIIHRSKTTLTIEALRASIT
jgi:5-methylcytosine-specific restriction protein A